MSNGRQKIPDSIKELTKKELIDAINNTVLGDEDTIIAIRALVDLRAQADIAAEVGYSRSAISRRIHKIVKKLQTTLSRGDT